MSNSEGETGSTRPPSRRLGRLLNLITGKSKAAKMPQVPLRHQASLDHPNNQGKDETDDETDDDLLEDESEYSGRRFRVLIVGKANTGKTTILRKLCNAAADELPLINGKVDVAESVQGEEGRGLHNIKDEITFKSHPGYVFHDSRGIECNSVDEVNLIHKFIKRRMKTGNFNTRLHAVWICVSASSDRPLQEAEMSLFMPQHELNLPVIAIITKCESLEVKAVSRLRIEHGLSQREAYAQAPYEVAKLLTEQFDSRLEQAGHPKSQIVHLSKMNKPGSSCLELVNATGLALNDDAVALLLVGLQKVNLDWYTELALAKAISKFYSNTDEKAEEDEEDDGQNAATKLTLKWFPYCWVSWK